MRPAGARKIMGWPPRNNDGMTKGSSATMGGRATGTGAGATTTDGGGAGMIGRGAVAMGGAIGDVMGLGAGCADDVAGRCGGAVPVACAEGGSEACLWN
jgi:hypothetical protein